MPGSNELINDLWFTVNYVPRALGKGFKYCVYGAVIGFASNFLFQEGLKQFAQDNHDSVDLTNQYVADDEQFLKLSRGVNNQITPPISDFLPIYSSLVGAGAGALFALYKVRNEYNEELSEDRQLRKMNIV